MYRIIKDKGYDKPVTVENTSTKATIIVGRMSISMLQILEEAGKPVTGAQFEKWDLEVNKETADKLVKLAMPMKKPIRTKKEIAKTRNKDIDAMDVLLGLAQYN